MVDDAADKVRFVAPVKVNAAVDVPSVQVIVPVPRVRDRVLARVDVNVPQVTL
jgi:acyl dehydratase